MALYQNVKEDTVGNQYVNMQDGSGTGITSTLISGKQALDVNIANAAVVIGVADKTAFTYGTTSFQAVGGVYQDTAPTLAAGESGSFRLTEYRAVHMNLRDAAGNEIGDANAAGVWVRPGDGTNAQAYSATSEAFAQLRQGGNVANVTASNELQTIDSNAGLILALMKPATSTLTQVALSTSTQVALASNAARKGMSFFNKSNKLIYIAMAATATASAFTVAMQANGYLEFMDDRVYTGVLSVIGDTGISGSLVVTELT